MKMEMQMQQEPKVKHSPLPWRLLEGKVPGYERYISVVHGENLSICQLTGAGSLNPKVLEEVRANSELIIRAVNNHDALVAAARFALSVLKANPVELSERTAIEKLEAALSAAQE